MGTDEVTGTDDVIGAGAATGTDEVASAGGATGTDRATTAGEVTRAVDLLVGQVAHWLAPRWAAPTADGRGRGDVVHALVQRMADRAAEAEGGSRRPVPRLVGDLGLPDQLRVMAADLVAAAPPPEVLAAAAADVTAVRRAL